MKLHTTNYPEALLGWFPEISPRLFKHFRVSSIEIIVDNLTVKGGVSKFKYKREKGMTDGT